MEIENPSEVWYNRGANQLNTILTKGALSLHTEYTTPREEKQAGAEWQFQTTSQDGWTGWQLKPDDQHTPLSDMTAKGTERPWKKHRSEAELLVMYYEQLSLTDPENAARWLAKAERVNRCACWTEFQRLPEGGLHLHDASFCRVRLCPMCQWRRSLKLGQQARAVIAAANAAKTSRDGCGYGWVMLTLTVRNVPGSDLGHTIDHLHTALNRMQHSQAWKDAVQGWMRATEITRNYVKNSKWYGTYHPHLHLLLCVNRRYFKSAAYISKDGWQKLWQHYADTDYPPEVEVHAIRDKATGQLAQDAKSDGKASIAGAIAETSKYIAKPAAYLAPEDAAGSLDAVQVLDMATEGRRLTAWGGVLKDTARDLKLDDVESGDLVHIDMEASGDPAADAAAEYISYAWSVGARDYLRTGSRKGAAPEQEKAAKAAKRVETAAAAAAHQRAESAAAMEKRAAEYKADPMEGLRSHRRHTQRVLRDDEAARALAAAAVEQHTKTEEAAVQLLRAGVRPTAAAVRAELHCKPAAASLIAAAMKDMDSAERDLMEGGE